MALGWLTIPGAWDWSLSWDMRLSVLSLGESWVSQGDCHPAWQCFQAGTWDFCMLGPGDTCCTHSLCLSLSPSEELKKKNKERLFVRNFPLIWPSGRASISSTNYLQAWDEGNRGCKGTQHIQCSFFLVCVLNAHKYLFWGDWLPLGWEFRYFWILII